jgi:branched-chain amino acid transport system permease protein
MLYFLQQLLNGFHAGALYALLAFGYALTNGVLHRTNLAYGPIFALAGQIAILTAVFGWQVLWLTLPATIALGIAVAFAYAALTGYVLSRSVLRPLAVRSPNAIIVATLGVALALGELGRIAADTRDLWLPPLLATPVVFAAGATFKVTLTVIQLIDCAVAAATLMILSLALSRSRFGRAWRAVSDDASAAALCGLDVRAVFTGAVVGGALLAALAGVMAALYYGNVSFGTGLIYGLKILFVTSLGGYRDPPRAAAGAALFGLAESLWTGYFAVEYRDAWMFGLLVAMLVLTGAGRDEARHRI